MNRVWFGFSVVALIIATYCFHVHEERQRFVKVGDLAASGAVIVMFDRKTRDLCVASLPSPTMNNAALCSRTK
jgi:hypothetical protein